MTMFVRSAMVSWVGWILLSAPGWCDLPDPSPSAPARYPIALALLQERLLVACRDGHLVVCDVEHRRPEHRIHLGCSLSAVAVLPDHRTVVATDRLGHQLVAATFEPTRGWTKQGSWPTPHSPVQLALSQSGDLLVVACLWARQVAVYDVLVAASSSTTLPVTLHQRYVIDLPFAPRALCIDEPSHSVLVGDAFADRVAVVDIHRGILRGLWSLPGSSIGTLAITGDGQHVLALTKYIHQFLPVERDHVFWGNIINHVVLAIDRRQLMDVGAVNVPAPSAAAHHALSTLPTWSSGTRKLTRWSVWPLGQPQQGSADAEALVPVDMGWMVALGGVDQVIFAERAGRDVRRCQVGRRPVAILPERTGARVFVANMFSHTVSVVDRHSWTEQWQITLSHNADRSLVAQGESDFYDARLSLDGWMSCHSCHTDGHMMAARFDNLGDEDYGAPKRVPSLLGSAGTAPFAWTGSRPELLTQIRKSLSTTMHGHLSGEDEHVALALRAYVESLPPPPGIATARRSVNREAAERGKRVFQQRACHQCHPPPYFTSADVYQLSLSDERGRRQFNPPSLLGVSQRDAWLHDGRARSLPEVFTRYEHPEPFRGSAQELADLLEYLSTL